MKDLGKIMKKRTVKLKENSDYLWQFYITVEQFYINFLV